MQLCNNVCFLKAFILKRQNQSFSLYIKCQINRVRYKNANVQFYAFLLSWSISYDLQLFL